MEAWAAALAHHPNADLCNFLIAGLTHGFRIGFNRGNPLSSARRNMPSAEAQSAVVEEYLQRELGAGRIIGPLPATSLHVNRFGVIPKGLTLGRSINDGIDLERCSMSYITVDAVAKKLAYLSPRALMAKVDVEAVYQLIPVHPKDQHLLAVQWKGGYFCDGAHPFGLRSAPKKV